MKNLIIIQSSLRQQSNTHIICRHFAEICDKKGLDVTYLDLRNIEMQLCDGRPLEEYGEDMQQVYTKLTQQDAIIFGMPVYQYSMSGVLKNFLDICGGALQSKQIGVIVNAGGPNCYMASQDLFNALQFEYETTNIMPIPYSCSADFKDGEVVNKKVLDKLYALAEKLISL